MDSQKIVVVEKPEEVNEIIKCFHVSFTSQQHLNIYKTIRTINKYYKCKNIVKKTQNFVKKCEICKKNKIKSKQKLGETDLRHKIKSIVGYSNTENLNSELRKINNKQ